MKLQQLNRTLMGALLISGALGVASQAHALNIVPGDADWTTNITSNLDQATLEGITGVSPLTLVYKQDEGGGESGAAMNYYSTTFTYDMSMEPVGASITWDGPLWIGCPTCVLVVKDGSQGTPAQYLFDLGNWDGQETLNLSGFWDGSQGAISNVAIWNTGGGSLVPEADTYAMLLAGLGLVGFAARRRLSKTA
jgi:PEP-CTERM motif